MSIFWLPPFRLPLNCRIPVVLVLTALALLATTLLPSVSRGADQPASLQARAAEYLRPLAVEYEKPMEVMSQQSQSQLKSAAMRGETLDFWVLYTDKGPDAATMLQDTDLKRAMLSRSQERRAKTSLNELLFVDLPVAQAYVDAIVASGAEHLATTRWLNGAAFRLSPETSDVLDNIAALPFVLEIRPCARGRRKQMDSEPQASPQNRGVSISASSAMLNYGPSLDQLAQIGSTVGHDSGYTGLGVVLAIFDTGFRTSHNAFASAFAEGRVIGERDYVQGDNNTANEGNDPPNQWNHGTLTWSAAGAEWANNVYGPAYKSDFIIAKTESLAGEFLQEEFDWIAAMEWADSLGASVISSSLVFNGYLPSQLDGSTVLASIVIGTAADLGIVVCNGAGNSGPGAQTLVAPADAFDMLAIGAVDLNGTIASFSSRGPTADGRIKPAVCARGVATYCANSTGDNWRTTASGTSLSTPLAAGVCAQLIQARPTFSARLIMRALKETASQSPIADNTYGYGIMNLAAALKWGVRYTVDGASQFPVVTEPGTSLQFADASDIVATSWVWSFGDGDSATVSDPIHQYISFGIYDVSLAITAPEGSFSRAYPQAVVVHADSVQLSADTVYAGQTVAISVDLNHTLPVHEIRIPLDFSQAPVTFDSVGTGLRITGLGQVALSAFDSAAMNVTATVDLAGDTLSPGQGEVLRFYFTVDDETIGGTEGTIAMPGAEAPTLTSEGVSYAPFAMGTTVATHEVLRADFNNDGQITSSDIVALVQWIFRNAGPPLTLQSGDANGDLVLNAADAIYLVNYVFKSGPPPPSP